MKKYLGNQTGESIDENVDLAKTSLQDINIKTKIESNESNDEFVVDVNSDKVNNIKEIELVFKIPSNNEDEELIVDDQLSSTSINPVQNKVITEELNKKGTYSKPQNGIPKNDLSNIVQRSLDKADTALQEHQDISGKVDKIEGKQLSTEDFTTILKQKLEKLSNYDDTDINKAVESLQTQLNTLLSGNVNDAINSFNEIIAFLEGVKDSENLDSIISTIELQIAGKQDVIDDLAAIRSGAQKGATALQEHQSLGDYAKTTDLAVVAMSGSYDDLEDKPDIPDTSSFATKTDLSNKVDKVSGKGLSSNDFTSTLLSKLNGIASGATKVTDSTVSGWGYLKSLNKSTSNFNNATTTGFIFSTFQASNIPATNYGTGFAINNTSPGNSYVAQLCLDYDANIYSRRRTGSTWSSWKSATMSASQYDQKDILSEEPLTIDQLATIKPIKFKFKNAEAYDDKEHIGGIAEEIEKHIPEGIRLVGGIKYVNYAETAFYMVSSLTQIVKEQHDIIKKLKEDITELKNIINK